MSKKKESKIIPVFKLLFPITAKKFPWFFPCEIFKVFIIVASTLLPVIVSPMIIEELVTDRDVKTLVILAAATLVIGGGLSLYASGNPDGLEWALFGNAEEGYAENMGLDEEEYGSSSAMADTAAEIQESTSFLPDYAFKDNDSAIGTTVSGIVGSGITAGIAALIAVAFGFFRSKKARES